MNNILKAGLFLLLAGACSSPVPPARQVETGSLAATLGGASRAVYPDFAGAVTHFKAVLTPKDFTPYSGTPAPLVTAKGNPTEISFTAVEVGTWELTVEAYAGDPGASGVLIGGSVPLTVTISSGSVTTVTDLPVGPLHSGTGLFTMALSFPAGKADSATLVLYPEVSKYLEDMADGILDGDAAGLSVGTLKQLSGLTSQVLLSEASFGDLSSGSYVAALQLSLGTSYRSQVFLETILIFGGLTTPWERTLTEDNFNPELSAPTGLAAEADSRGTVVLTWTDTNLTESGYLVEFREDGQTWETATLTGPSIETLTITGLKEETVYGFRVAAVNGAYGQASDPTAEVMAVLGPYLLFVDKNAAVAGSGTEALPFQTLSEALGMAVPGDTVRIRGGWYQESFIVDGATDSHLGQITLEGGYSPSDWSVRDPEAFRTVIWADTPGVPVVSVQNVADNPFTLDMLSVFQKDGSGLRIALEVVSSEVSISTSALITGAVYSAPGADRARGLVLKGDGSTSRSVVLDNTEIYSGEVTSGADLGDSNIAVDAQDTFRGTLRLAGGTRLYTVGAGNELTAIRMGNTPAALEVEDAYISVRGISSASSPNSAYGIYLTGGTSLTLRNSRFQLTKGLRPQYGVFMSSSGSFAAPPVIEGNLFNIGSSDTSESATLSGTGIRLDGNYPGNALVQANRFTIDYRGLNPSIGLEVKTGSAWVFNNYFEFEGNYAANGGQTRFVDFSSFGSTQDTLIYHNSFVVKGQISGSLAYVRLAGTSGVQIINNLFTDLSGYFQGTAVEVTTGADDFKPKNLQNNNFWNLYALFKNLNTSFTLLQEQVTDLNNPAQPVAKSVNSGNLTLNPKLRPLNDQEYSSPLGLSDYSPSGLYRGGLDLTAWVAADYAGTLRTGGPVPSGVSMGAWERESAFFADKGLLAEWLFEEYSYDELTSVTIFTDTTGNGRPLFKSGEHYLQDQPKTRLDRPGYESSVRTMDRYGAGNPGISTFTPALTALSFSLWVGEIEEGGSDTFTPGAGGAMIDAYNSALSTGFALRFDRPDAITYRLRLMNGSSTPINVNLPAGDIKRWNHAVLVFGGTSAGSSVSLYWNGSLLAGTSLLQTLTFDSGGLSFGTASADPQQALYSLADGNFPGSVDDIRMFSTALGAADVAYLYGEGEYTLSDTLPPVLRSGKNLRYTYYMTEDYGPPYNTYAHTTWESDTFTEPLWKVVVDYGSDYVSIVDYTESGTGYSPDGPMGVGTVSALSGQTKTWKLTLFDLAGNRTVLTTPVIPLVKGVRVYTGTNILDPGIYTYALDVRDESYNWKYDGSAEWEKGTPSPEAWTFSLWDSNSPPGGMPEGTTDDPVWWYLDTVKQSPPTTEITLGAAALNTLAPGVHRMTAVFKNPNNGHYYSVHFSFRVVDRNP